jgi:hypothetical protein
VTSLSLCQLGQRKQALAKGESALTILEEIESPDAEEVRWQLGKWRAAPRQ